MTRITKGTYFISHSYKDKDIRQQMIYALPNGVKPHIFPPINVAPEEFVSNKLIQSILGCDGLIYLDGGHSALSFWVAFERDYAKRAGKPVYAYNPETKTLRQDDEPAMDLHIFASCTAFDRPHVNQILHHMREQRFFNISDYTSVRGKRNQERQIPTEKLIRESIIEKLNRDGYMVCFWSAKASKSKFTRFEIEFSHEYSKSLTLNPDDPNNTRVLLAQIDNTPFTDWVKAIFDENGATRPVQLYTDRTLSLTNRIDNLVVRLYWLIFHSQRPELAYD